MATRRRPKRREAQLAFEALSIEGGLLSPDWLARAAKLEAGSQAEADYRIMKGLNLRDEMGRFWRVAQAYHSEFKTGRAAKADSKVIADRFVTGLLKDVFGFSTLEATEPRVVAERTYPVGWVALGGRVPVVIAPAGLGLDTLSSAFGDGTRKRSAFGLAQEYLNAAEGAMWGIATDGQSLRILRDNASLTRPAWIEADLERMFTEDRYSDFTALWLIAHETRFGRADQPSSECALEAWRASGREEGTRAREHLRRGVEDALVALGQGFLSHPDNGALRAAYEARTLTKEAYFQQLLRLVYRLIFLLTAEERDLLHASGADEAAKKLYADGYGLRRLRERSTRRSAHDRFSDLWAALKITFRGLAKGEPKLGLPALAGIFAEDQCAALDAAKLENRWLLQAVFRLSWLREESGLSRVNWRDMGPEELGSVYESLLELVPQITEGGRTFAFASGAETKGNERKKTGSYYTPDSLVQVLLDSALEPVIEQTIAANPTRTVDALLELSIVDPACGSGHFLLAAARRLAAHVARIEANGTPSAAEYRHALRQVVSRCIYGVDLNPMAVELCKVSLWMEAVEPGRPLSFLDAHIQQGNALLGTTPELMAGGIPDAAWEPTEGDDRKTASALKKRNKAAGKGDQATFHTAWVKKSEEERSQIAGAIAELEASAEDDLGAVTKKEERWEQLLLSDAYGHQRFVADAWCAAFVWPKQPGPLAEAAPTNDLWREIRGGAPAPALTVKTVKELAAEYSFFHWHLQFPRVFERGGFDVVLGNPPWERVKLQEQEFFATRDESIALAKNATARKRIISELPTSNPPLWERWIQASRKAEGESRLIRHSGRFPLCGTGDINTYAIFAEHNRTVSSPRGRAGFITPTGLATDDTTKNFFRDLIQRSELSRLYSFENEEFVFPSIHHATRFALVTLAKNQAHPAADLVFFARKVSDLSQHQRHFTLSRSDFSRLNPNTQTCPTFRSEKDARINLAIYSRSGILWNETSTDGNPWSLEVRTRLWHMAEDAEWFRTERDLQKDGWTRRGRSWNLRDEHYVRLYEAKMVHLFDHRFGTYSGQSTAQENQGKLPELDETTHGNPDALAEPRYWVPEAEVEKRLREVWSRGWLLGWREITGSSVVRTVIAALVPRTAVGHKLPLLLPAAPAHEVACLYANLCAFALDYAARQKVGGLTLALFSLKQLPLFPPSTYQHPAAWNRAYATHTWVQARVLELTYTACDLQPFASDVGYDGPPFRWDPERRALLRAELDAAFFHLYGLSRDDTDYVMETFPIVRRNDEKAYGEYRTKRLILEIYDAMAEAIRTGKPYETRLDPPPADPRVAHPPRAEAKPSKR
ncbi:N-6 DNA methylase [Myxococcota bacterium]|nr:N-6 DNA methylase [Myxococcota bacterium]